MLIPEAFVGRGAGIVVGGIFGSMPLQFKAVRGGESACVLGRVGVFFVLFGDIVAPWQEPGMDSCLLSAKAGGELEAAQVLEKTALR